MTKNEQLACEDGDAGVVRDSSPKYISRPTFDTDQIVDWDCPNCGEPGFDDRRSADYYPICTNSDCAVKMFSVFRGGTDAKDAREEKQ